MPFYGTRGHDLGSGYDLCTGVNGGLFCYVLVRGRMMLFVKNLMYSDCLVTTLVEDK